MEDLAGQPALAEALLQRLADAACADLARYLDAVGEYIDIVQVGDDLGTQNGPQLSPRMYRRLVKPYQQQMWQFIKARSGLPVFLHCCGGIYPLIPDLIEAGVDILNPVQISAVGMDPVRLKAEFGRDLVFWGGGCDTQHVLPEGTPAQVADHVRRQIDILAPGGGFVFNQVHNIQANVPPENIVAMLDAALAYGGYSRQSVAQSSAFQSSSVVRPSSFVPVGVISHRRQSSYEIRTVLVCLQQLLAAVRDPQPGPHGLRRDRGVGRPAAHVPAGSARATAGDSRSAGRVRHGGVPRHPGAVPLSIAAGLSQREGAPGQRALHHGQRR